MLRGTPLLDYWAQLIGLQSPAAAAKRMQARSYSVRGVGDHSSCCSARCYALIYKMLGASATVVLFARLGAVLLLDIVANLFGLKHDWGHQRLWSLLLGSVLCHCERLLQTCLGSSLTEPCFPAAWADFGRHCCCFQVEWWPPAAPASSRPVPSLCPVTSDVSIFSAHRQRSFCSVRACAECHNAPC